MPDQAQHHIQEPQRQRDQRQRGDALAPEMAGAGMAGAHALHLVQRCLRRFSLQIPRMAGPDQGEDADAPTRKDSAKTITLLRSATFLSKAIAQVPGQVPQAVEEVIGTATR